MSANIDKLREFINLVKRADAFGLRVSLPTGLAITAMEFIEGKMAAAARKISRIKKKRSPDELKAMNRKRVRRFRERMKQAKENDMESIYAEKISFLH